MRATENQGSSSVTLHPWHHAVHTECAYTHHKKKMHLNRRRGPWREIDRQTDAGVNNLNWWVEVPRATGRIGSITQWERLYPEARGPGWGQGKARRWKKSPSFWGEEAMMHAGDPHARPRALRVFTAVTLLCRRRRGLVTEAAQNSSRGLPAEEAGPHLRSRLPASPRGSCNARCPGQAEVLHRL